MRVEQTETFSRWLRKLKDHAARARIIDRIVTIQESGHLGDVRSVGGNVSELRFHTGPGYRVYFTMKGETVILLLVGGSKGSQVRDIAKARQLATEERR